MQPNHYSRVAHSVFAQDLQSDKKFTCFRAVLDRSMSTFRRIRKVLRAELKALTVRGTDADHQRLEIASGASPRTKRLLDHKEGGGHVYSRYQPSFPSTSSLFAVTKVCLSVVAEKPLTDADLLHQRNQKFDDRRSRFSGESRTEVPGARGSFRRKLSCSPHLKTKTSSCSLGFQ